MKIRFRLLLLGSVAIASLGAERVIWSSEVGRLDSGATHAVFTLVATEDATRPGQQSRVLRVALSSPDGTGTRYIAEAGLPLLRKKIDGLVAASARDLLENSPNAMLSTSCPGEKEKSPLDVGYHVQYAQTPELLLGGDGLPDFVFVGSKPAQLADIFSKAIGELRSLSDRKTDAD